jgi:hypothetical protein
MFGKGKAAQSETSKFIMAAGRAVGNIKPPPKSADRKGNGSVKKTAPAGADKAPMPSKPVRGKSGALGKAGPVRIA